MAVHGSLWDEGTAPVDRAPKLPAAVRAHYPFVPRQLVVPGGHLAYVDAGDGPPVLFLHGNPTWSFLWREAIMDLRGRRRCVAPDHFGMGLSDRALDGRPRRLLEHIENIERLIDHLGWKRFDLVVHDWGGAIGFGYARRHPERIGRIVVTNSAAFQGPLPKRIAICRAGRLGRFLVEQGNAFAGLAPVMGVVKPLPPAIRLGYRWPYPDAARRRAVADFIQDIPLESDHPTRPELDAIEKALPSFRDHPLTLIWGGRDFCFHDGFLAQWQERFPGATTHRFAHASHLVLEDAGRPELAAALG